MQDPPKLLDSRTRSFAWLRSWPVIIALVVVLVVLLLLGSRLVSWLSIHWGYSRLKELFYQKLGLANSFSTFLATALAFFYAVAWLPLVYLSFRKIEWRKLAVTYVAYMFIYGLPPALESAFGSDVCFNQETGEPLKWYIADAAGKITLFDSGGFDSRSGTPKKPVTMQICQIYEDQAKGIGPRLVTDNPANVQFFDPVSGEARVWYDTGSDGSVRLFSAPGFDPASSDALKPVTKDIAAKAQDQAAQAATPSSAAPVTPGYSLPTTQPPTQTLPNNVNVGTLTCNVADGGEFKIGVSKFLLCILRKSDGTTLQYSGRILRYGLDIGYPAGHAPVWTVMAPTSDTQPDALNGDYASASEVTSKTGTGVLVGGLTRSISLRTLDGSDNGGLNVAAGIRSMNLSYAP